MTNSSSEERTMVSEPDPYECLPKVIAALHEARMQLDTPSEWHWSLWYDIDRLQKRANAFLKQKPATSEEPTR